MNGIDLSQLQALMGLEDFELAQASQPAMQGLQGMMDPAQGMVQAGGAMMPQAVIEMMNLLSPDQRVQNQGVAMPRADTGVVQTHQQLPRARTVSPQPHQQQQGDPLKDLARARRVWQQGGKKGPAPTPKNYQQFLRGK